MRRRYSFTPPRPPEQIVAIVKALLADEQVLIRAMTKDAPPRSKEK